MSKTATMSTLTSEIPLHRLSVKVYTSSLFSTKSTFPPSYASSLAPTEQGLLSSPLAPFEAKTSLQIQAAGKSMNSLPISMYELCIPLFVYEENGMAERPKWLSNRPTKKNGTSALVDAEDEIQTAVTTTTYRFGPERPPFVRIERNGGGVDESDEDDLAAHHESNGEPTSKARNKGNVTGRRSSNQKEIEEFPITIKRIFSRTSQFISPRYGTFEWRYCNRKEKASFPLSSRSFSIPPSNLLVLDKIFKNGHGKEIGRLRVAQLVRGDGERTPGTKYSTAGNGGRLEMCLERDGEEDAGSEVLIDEVIVVSTVLVMLKKEIDDQG